MSRSERHAFFERIAAMRDGYLASPDDQRWVLSISDAIRYGEAIMTAVELDAEPWLAEPDQVDVEVTGEEPDQTGHVRVSRRIYGRGRSAPLILFAAATRPTGPTGADQG